MGKGLSERYSSAAENTLPSLWERIKPALIEQDSSLKKKKVASKKTRIRKLFFVLADIAGFLLWLYVFIKSFVFDFDLYLADQFNPSLDAFLKYRFFFFVALVAVIILFYRNYWALFLYILFFPVIVILWKIPKLIYKTQSWLLVLGIFEFLASLVQNFRYKAVKNTVALFSALAIFLTVSKAFLGLSIFALFLILIIDFFRLVATALKGSQFLSLQSNIIKKFRSSGVGQSLITIRGDLVTDTTDLILSKEKASMVLTRLQTAVLFSRVVRYWALQLEKYRDSRISFFLSTASYMRFVLETLLFFSLINYALYRIEPSNFLVSQGPTFFQFLYYSFASLLSREITVIVTSSDLAILIYMTSALIGWLVIPVLLLDFWINSRRNRSNEELDKAIQDVKKEGKAIDSIIEKEYEMTIEEAISKLSELKGVIIGWIYKISSSLPEE